MSSKFHYKSNWGFSSADQIAYAAHATLQKCSARWRNCYSPRTTRKIRKYRNVTRGCSSGSTWRDRTWTNTLAREFLLMCLPCSSDCAWIFKKRSLYRHEPVTESVYMRKRVYIRMTGVACEGARAVCKYVRLVRAVETNWNHKRARSEVYRRDGNYLEMYAFYVQGARKEFILAVKIENGDGSK